ncbi:MAG: RtcB family protein [Candidatus Riflebacteria bacterium]|nr:RtcB family protein [Candidatus Riflebacteria bacterium]
MDETSGTNSPALIPTGEATAILPAPDGKGKPITVIATEAIRNGFDATCLRQALNSRQAPGVTDLVLNPDAHAGYGAPIGCVLVSPTHIYPGPVGVDIKCSMSLLQLDLPVEAVARKETRRALIQAICERTPTGAGKGQRSVKKSRRVDHDLGRLAAIHGASPEVCEALGLESEWASRCEDAFHVGHDGTADALALRLDSLLASGRFGRFDDKVGQLGSYGGGNHFGECEVVQVADHEAARSAASAFGLLDGRVAFLSHCGSRGFGYQLAHGQFKRLQEHFARWSIPLPGADRELVYAPLGTPEADDYLDDMALGGNFATVNHLLINALVLEAFQEVIPGTRGELVYFISHNIARREVVDNKMVWVHRKGATRAFPAHHPGLKGTRFAATGHPILLPGNPVAGSVVMVAEQDAVKSCFSVNHGAGRAMGRKAAQRTLDQETVDRQFVDSDILTNCRFYPRDEAPVAYKEFDQVLRSVEAAGLARRVATLSARFVIKDASAADD